MARLTTHVLDTARGVPAGGMRIDLYGLDGTRSLLKSVSTNGNGRTDEPVLPAAAPGAYELVFHVGDYFRRAQVAGAGPSFLDEVPIRFSIVEPDGHYHVPLLVSPWSYTTYRGS